MFDDGMSPEILTVDNHADGPYLYLKMKEENPERAKEVFELLEMNEGNSSGRRHRLCQLGRRGLCRSVLAQSAAGQCPAKALQ